MYEMFIVCSTVLGTLLVLQDCDKHTRGSIYLAFSLLGMLSILGLVVIDLSCLLHVVSQY